MATKVIDKGYNEIRKQFKFMKKAQLDVGILASKEKPTSSGITVPEIAIVQEFGSTKRGIPERSFLRSTATKNDRKYRALLRAGIGEILSGTTTTFKMLDKFGKIVTGDVQRTITSLKTPPLAASTIRAKKGKSNPLIDEGTLRSRIKSRVKL